MGQIFWTHTDSGGTQFNFSEIVGNSTAVAISSAYYPDGRDVSSAVSKLGSQIGIDMAGNILKEFWPDLRRKFSRDRRATGSPQPESLDKRHSRRSEDAGISRWCRVEQSAGGRCRMGVWRDRLVQTRALPASLQLFAERWRHIQRLQAALAVRKAARGRPHLFLRREFRIQYQPKAVGSTALPIRGSTDHRMALETCRGIALETRRHHR
jgi:hypothetical protein